MKQFEKAKQEKLERQAEEQEEIDRLEKARRKQLKEIKKQKYAHERIDAKYRSETLLPNLARETHIRNEIKTLHRPIRRDEIDDHERAY